MKLLEKVQTISDGFVKETYESSIEKELKHVITQVINAAGDGSTNLRIMGLKFPHEMKKYFVTEGFKVSLYSEYSTYHQKTLPTGEILIDWTK